jgi:hypothetical protein
MAIDEGQILTDLSAALRVEVTDFIMASLMEEVALFRLLPPTYWPFVLPLLRPCRFSAGEVLCVQGGEASEMYVILGGECTETSLHGSLLPIADDVEEIAPSIGACDSGSCSSNDTLGGSPCSGGQVVSTRPIGVGDVVNPLAALGVWPKAVGTVVANEVTEAYAVVAKGFQALFRDDDARLKQTQGRVVFVEYVTVADPRAPTCWGVPVLHRPPDDALRRAFLFEEQHRATKRTERDERNKRAADALLAACQHSHQGATTAAFPGATPLTAPGRLDTGEEEKVAWGIENDGRNRDKAFF